VFDVVASVGEAIYKALFVNPLKAFRSSFNNGIPKDKYSGGGRLFENFRTDLEQFCRRERLSMPEVNLSEDGRKLLQKCGFNLTIQTTQAVFTNLKQVPQKGSNASSGSSDKQDFSRQEVLSVFFTDKFEVTDFEYDEISVEEVRTEFDNFADRKIILRNSDVLAQGCKVVERDIWNVSLRKMKPASWIMKPLSRVRESFAAISSNVSLNIILPLPLVFLAFVQQAEERSFALPGDDIFTLQTALVGPARDRPRATAFEAGYLSWQLTAMLSFFVGYLVVFVLDYSLYLLLPQLEPALESKEDKTRKFSQRSKLRWVQYVAHSVYMALLFFAIAAILSYVCLVFTWALLASVVNPVRFLALTTTFAGTAAAILGRFQSMTSLQKQVSQKVTYIPL
jgi:hypothetical protein